MYTHLTSKPGEFRARCNLNSEISWDKMTEESWAIANERGYKREFREVPSLKVDPETRKHGRWVVVFGGCEGFETTDRAAFEQHMADAHGHKPNGPRQLKLGQGMWRTPPARALDLSGLQTCERCGLVAEISEIDTLANRRWWDEHLAKCAGDQAGAA